jgi:two-component system, OmpR family, sensor histidine kinase PrrB
MRLATRTALAAFAAAFLTLALTGAVFRGRFTDVLQDRVDAQLEDRAESAPILAAIAGRLSRSELVATVAPAQVLVDGELIRLGELPGEALPAPSVAGWQTVVVAGDRWRLHTIEVLDVPDVGDRTLVQLAEPLGDVDAEVRALRRRLVLAGLIVSIAAGVVGWLLGGLATRPLTLLRRDAGSLRDDDPATWRVGERYGSPEVDDVAETLNTNLRRLADETIERQRALAAARAFAASASHELRTPLQGALTNLDIAGSDRAGDAERAEAVTLAHRQVQRMAASLAAVRTLADAEFADPAWFEPVDLAELTESVVADERRRAPDAIVDMAVDGDPAVRALWREGAQLAIGNVVRNALVHGHAPGAVSRVRVTVAEASIVVDDAGPGVAPPDRERVLGRFEKGAGSGGSGLGLAIAREVASAHAGSVAITTSPDGGARVTLTFAPDVRAVSDAG